MRKTLSAQIQADAAAILNIQEIPIILSLKITKILKKETK